MRPARPILAASALLAASAGFVNVVLLRAELTPVTHVTGAVSALSDDVGDADFAHGLRVLSIVASFILGAGVSGFIIGSDQVRFGRPYGVAMLVQGALLAVATGLLLRDLSAGVLLAAVSAGAQNAMASSYGGLIIRTTHVTGVATDLGFMLGVWARRRRVERWKLLHLGMLLASFFSGGVAGAVASVRYGVVALAVPSALALTLGAAYFIYRLRRSSEP